MFLSHLSQGPVYRDAVISEGTPSFTSYRLHGNTRILRAYFASSPVFAAGITEMNKTLILPPRM